MARIFSPRIHLPIPLCMHFSCLFHLLWSERAVDFSLSSLTLTHLRMFRMPLAWHLSASHDPDKLCLFWLEYLTKAMLWFIPGRWIRISKQQQLMSAHPITGGWCWLGCSGSRAPASLFHYLGLNYSVAMKRYVLRRYSDVLWIYFFSPASVCRQQWLFWKGLSPLRWWASGGFQSPFLLHEFNWHLL